MAGHSFVLRECVYAGEVILEVLLVLRQSPCQGGRLWLEVQGPCPRVSVRKKMLC